MGTLQRVGWRLEGEALVRYHWNVLDRGFDSQPVRVALLDGVGSLRVRLLDGERRWRRDWPPPGVDSMATVERQNILCAVAVSVVVLE